MDNFLDGPEFDFINSKDKCFIYDFNQAMNHVGYDFGGTIGSGYCWGRYMLIYAKTGVKSKKVVARIYIRENGLVLRMYFSGIDRHRAFLERAPDFIQEPFIGPIGDCHHCHNEKDGLCKFRKTYCLHNLFIEKCNGLTFEFSNPDSSRLKHYMGLFCEFYPSRIFTR